VYAPQVRINMYERKSEARALPARARYILSIVYSLYGQSRTIILHSSRPPVRILYNNNDNVIGFCYFYSGLDRPLVDGLKKFKLNFHPCIIVDNAQGQLRYYVIMHKVPIRSNLINLHIITLKYSSRII